MDEFPNAASARAQVAQRLADIKVETDKLYEQLPDEQKQIALEAIQKAINENKTQTDFVIIGRIHHDFFTFLESNGYRIVENRVRHKWVKIQIGYTFHGEIFNINVEN